MGSALSYRSQELTIPVRLDLPLVQLQLQAHLHRRTAARSGRSSVEQDPSRGGLAARDQRKLLPEGITGRRRRDAVGQNPIRGGQTCASQRGRIGSQPRLPPLQSAGLTCASASRAFSTSGPRISSGSGRSTTVLTISLCARSASRSSRSDQPSTMVKLVSVTSP